MQYCKNYTTFHNMDIITQVTIPITLSTDLLISLSELTFKYGGKVLNFGTSEDETTVFLLKFFDDTSRNNFCEEVENFINLSINKVSITPVIDSDGKQTLKIAIDLKFALEELQNLLEESRPIVNFIASNGGFEPEENLFDGFFALEETIGNNALTKEVKDSLDFVLNFMSAYTIASEALENIESFDKIKPGHKSIQINVMVLYHRFQLALEKLNPIITFIESHGGWADKKTGKFEGFDAFSKAKVKNTITNEIETSIEILTKLIAGYTLGKQALVSSSILEHNN